jgi:hypothetical protein
MDPQPFLKRILRYIGTMSLLALIFVAAPYEWMSSIHAALGLGELPDDPIVGYLARSLSAFYAMIGGVFWVVSFDLVRHRPLLLYIGPAIALLGVALLFVDLHEGLPLAWTVWEGPFVCVVGTTIWTLSRRLPAA